MHRLRATARRRLPRKGFARPSLYDLPELYDAIMQRGPCEAFYREEARRAAGSVLELACGTGRVTLPLALDGHEIVGLDALPQMLATARNKAARAGLSPALMLGDMRRFALGRRFALVVVSCNSLAHLIETEDVQACLSTVRRHLAPGGTLAFDVVSPDIRVLAGLPGEHRRLDGGPNPASAVPAVERALYDPIRQLRIAYWRVWLRDGAARSLAPLMLRQFFPQELPVLLRSAGLILQARYGDFARNPLAAGSLNQVCLAGIAPGS
jgi:SAM-dependent methyltransferase